MTNLRCTLDSIIFICCEREYCLLSQYITGVILILH